MTFTESLAARRVYELERQQPGRSYAKEHGFEEWMDWTGIGVSQQPVIELSLSGFSESEAQEIVRGYVSRQDV